MADLMFRANALAGLKPYAQHDIHAAVGTYMYATTTDGTHHSYAMLERIDGATLHFRYWGDAVPFTLHCEDIAALNH